MRLSQELHRLYRTPDPVSASPDAAADGTEYVRALVLEIARPADWTALSAVWHGVQTDWDWPAAAIAVSGTDGLQLWFSTAAAVSARDASALLQGLQQRYLSAIPAKRLQHYPHASAQDAKVWVRANEVPALQDSGNWSAFISADLPAVFVDEPWLDLPPNREQQADILSRMRSITPSQFEQALVHLGVAHQVRAHQPPVAVAPVDAGGALTPEAFLQQVMNDPRVEMQHRIEAARVLLVHGSGSTAG